MRTFRQLLSGDDIIQLAVRLGLLALLVYWSFILIQPFVPILAWSVVLAVAFYPLFSWLAKWLGGRPKLAATILTIVNLCIVIGPAAWLGVGAVEGLKDLATRLNEGDLVFPSPPEQIKEWALIGPQLYDLWDQASTNLRTVLGELAPHLKPVAGTILGFAGNAGVGTLQFLLAVALAGFLFPSGPRLVATSTRFLARVVPERGEDFMALAAATIRGVSQGVIGVAIVQALLSGIGFKLAGISIAGLLAFAVLILAILQIGSAVVLLPVIIWLWMSKDIGAALPLTVFFVIVGLIDNVLKPLVMGRGLTTPTLVIFIGVIGGTLAHGIVGLFIGPIILAVAWELMGAWIRDERVKLAQPD